MDYLIFGLGIGLGLFLGLGVGHAWGRADEREWQRMGAEFRKKMGWA